MVDEHHHENRHHFFGEYVDVKVLVQASGAVSS